MKRLLRRRERSSSTMTPRYCIACGMALTDGARFCGNCGQEAVDLVQAVARPSVLGVKTRVCPQCGLADKVDKVSGIVAAQSREEQREWRDSDSNRHSRTVPTSTQLVSQLKLPQPYKVKTFPEIIAKSAFTLFFISFFTFVLSMIIGGFIATAQDDFSFPPRFFVPVFIFIVAIEAIIAIPYAAQVRKLRNEAVIEGQRWSQRKPGWDKLYYCYRDDVVFFDGRCAPSSRMLEFLDGNRIPSEHGHSPS